jgi:hypothetical protein
MATENVPSKLTGGCNCNAIRYSIALASDTKWPLENNGTCQCTACRKFTGCIVPQCISVPTDTISPPLKSNPSYKHWDSGKGGLRGFCTTCGSSLTFQYVSRLETTEIMLGGLDEEILVGAKTGFDYDCGEYGKKSTRESEGFGQALVDTSKSGHIWLENSIKGWTDSMPGMKWWRERASGKGFTADDGHLEIGYYGLSSKNLQ